MIGLVETGAGELLASLLSIWLNPVSAMVHSPMPLSILIKKNERIEFIEFSIQ